MADGQKERKLKGVYLVPDPLMMKPRFGPSEHIKAGMHELSKYFEMTLVVLGEAKSFDATSTSGSATSRIGLKNGLVGLMRDVKLYIRSNSNFSDVVRRLADLKPDFIYERGQYLDLRGVRAANQLGIAHFYEVNWLNFLGIRQFYKSWFNPLAKMIEEKSYRRSTLNFFIGTQHKLINIPGNKVFMIQNGIEEDVVLKNELHKNEVKAKIKLCFVANLMPHHRFDIFCEALKRCGSLDRLELHTVGYNFEEALHLLPRELKVVNHGPKKKEDLAQLLGSFNIGVISGGPSYSSFMKLFEYAAFKLCVICPDLENVRIMFKENEILYFSENNSLSMAAKLKQLIEDTRLIAFYGGNIYEKTKQHYTWKRIYNDVAIQIRRRVPDS